MYNPESINNGIEKCKENIKIFEEAIENERATIKEYYDILDTLNKKERQLKEAREKIHIEIDNHG